MNGQPAIVFHHPSAPTPVLHDPRDPPVKYPTEEQMVRKEATDVLTLLVEMHGVQTVYGWLRTIAAINGEAL